MNNMTPHVADEQSLSFLLDWLVGYRRKLGLSQRRVARSMGAGNTSVYYMETQAKSPSVPTLQAYCRALGGELNIGFEFSKTDDGVGSQPVSPAGAAVSPPAPSSPRTFELVRHHDVSGQTGTGVVAEGVQFTDLTAALRWRGGHPATAVWPNVEEILAVHGHQGATELRWLDERTCRVCGCIDESACVGGCYWVADDLCSQCGVPS